MKKFFLFLALAICMTALTRQTAYAIQLSGTYTIDAAGPATASSFKDFTSAITYLSGSGVRPDGGIANTAPFGLSGPVKFNVAAGTYSGQVIINGNIVTGLSATNTLTFEGVNAATTIVSTSIINQACFIINKGRYIILRNLSAVNNSANSTAIAITGNVTGNGGTGCRIAGCRVIVNASTNAYGINITADSTGWLQTAMRADSISIDSNFISAPTGICITGAGTPAFNRLTRITYDSIVCTANGVYLNSIYNGVDVMYNRISSSLFATVGQGYMVYLRNCTNSGPQQHRLVGNKMNSAGSGINFDLDTLPRPAGYPTLIYNNMITGKQNGITLSTGRAFYQVHHNSINMSNQALTEFAGVLGFYYQNPPWYPGLPQ